MNSLLAIPKKKKYSNFVVNVYPEGEAIVNDVYLRDADGFPINYDSRSGTCYIFNSLERGVYYFNC